jgi:protein-S-isoprenylcysteine O-methyltransferase Ste14
MSAVARKTLLGLAPAFITLTLLFAPAWSLRFWQAWLYLLVMAAASVAIFAYLRQKDPQLLERRTRGPGAEKEPSQKFLHLFALLIFAGAIVVSSLDHRFLWSHVPLLVEIAGCGLVLLGFFIYSVVFRENTFGGATVEVVSGQRVITTGPYGFVRHPMYTGLLVLLFGTPLALGSWLGLLMVVPMTLVLALRIGYEEQFLTENLPGYAEYCRTHRYRLVPCIW